ncbi:tripartite motif-containing protein 3-like [Branchiostoma lanceolatum]|uniref:tripartite motif-containing protein 3-like n=1 Tax=Branchiostoma lanceolatum TaxID=7740 RepID=UPI00345612CB
MNIHNCFIFFTIFTDGGRDPMRPSLSCSLHVCAVITGFAAAAMILSGLFLAWPIASRQSTPPYPTAQIRITKTATVHIAHSTTAYPSSTAAYTAVFEPANTVLLSTEGETTTTLQKASHTSIDMEETTEDTGDGDVITFGGRGSTLGKFARLSGVVVSSRNEIVVVDQDKRRVQVFNMKGVYIRHFLTTVPGKVGRTVIPEDISIDGNDNLWVVGNVNFVGSFVVQYNRDGRALRKFKVQRSRWDRGIAVDVRSNHILVTNSDIGTYELHVFHPNGSFVRKLGSENSFSQVIEVNRDGSILTIRNNMVHVYNQTGHLLFNFGGHGIGDGKVINPRGICTDTTGHIWVASCGKWREKGWVSMFTSRGQFVRHVVTGLRMVNRIAVGQEGQLVVTEVGDNTVTIYTTLTD